MTKKFRSQVWFDDPDHPDLTALSLERYMNYGLTPEELRSGRPIIGIAQSGSDLAPCNRHHLELAQRVREGIRDAGGIALEFPVHAIHENAKRPTAALDRNLSYLALVEVLYGYPLDAVVLTIGCDKTTPAALMAACTVDIPAIALSVGPMLNGWHKGERVGSGAIIWKAREMLAAGEIDYEGFIEMAARSAPSVGYCNTMGTASTMNCLTEALGMSLPGSATAPAPYRERPQLAYRTGRRIVEMAYEDLKPSDILSRASFLNAVAVSAAIGGSTNAAVHVTALARHAHIDFSLTDFQTHGHDLPLLVNLQPAGHYLSEDFHQAGGVPAVVGELLRHGKVDPDARTVNGRTLGENCADAEIVLPDVIRPFDAPLREKAGVLVVRSNLFDSAIMKTSVISPEFRERFLSNPDAPNVFEGRAVVFDGPEDYHARIDDPAEAIDEKSILIMRGAGPIGHPGAAEVVNMRPPKHLIEKGVTALPCIGDGRQSGTSGSPSILHVSPEAAAGGDIALVRNGDPMRIDLNAATLTWQVDDAEIAARRAALEDAGGYAMPPSQTPWQELQREKVGQLETGAVLEPAVKYYRIIDRFGNPRANH